MSLINQMLKDLAHRSKPISNPETLLSGLITSRSKKIQKNNFFYLFRISSVIFSLLLISVIAQHFVLAEKSTNTKETIKMMVPSPALPTVDTTASVYPALKPAALTSIASEVQNDITHLRFLLNYPILYRIQRTSESELVITFENSQLLTDLPAFDPTNSAIKSIRMAPEETDNFKIYLTLNEGAELKKINLDEISGPELQIDFAYAMPKNQVADLNANDESLTTSTNLPIKKSSSAEIENQYRNAIALVNQGQVIQAILELNQILTKQPDFTLARQSYATFLFQQGDFQEAEKAVDIGLNQHPLYAPYLQIKAEILAGEGKIGQALTLLQKNPPSLDENPEYHALLAALYQKDNQFQLAEKIYEELIKMQPSNSIWWMGLAITREKLKKNQAALQAYEYAGQKENLSPELKVFIENRIRLLS